MLHSGCWQHRRREVESVICVSDRPKSGSVGRVGPESILSRFWVGRSENVDPKPPETAQNRLKPPKNSRSDPKFLRRAPRSGSVGRDRPTQNHSKWRPLGRSVGYADYNFYFGVAPPMTEPLSWAVSSTKVQLSRELRGVPSKNSSDLSSGRRPMSKTDEFLEGTPISF